MSEQKFSEEDIVSVLIWLKHNDPENVNRETALALLQDLHEGYRSMRQHDPDRLLELQRIIDENKKNESA